MDKEYFEDEIGGYCDLISDWEECAEFDQEEVCRENQIVQQ